MQEAKRNESGALVLEEDEKLLHAEGKTEMLFTGEQSQGAGTLSITNK